MSAPDHVRPSGDASEVPLLALTGIVKRFGAVTALDGASMEVRPGTLHALLGENGAGKTTLMRVAFGLVQPDAGTVLIDGTARRIRAPSDAIASGIGMVHQHFTVVPAMTVAENVALGGEGRYDAAAAARRVEDVGSRTGLQLDPSATAEFLSVAAQQRLEIVKALARDARLLILDEPTAVLAPDEAQALLQWLRSFASGQRAVVLITHKLRDALANADDITVLRRGRTVATLAAATATEATLAAAMLGGSPLNAAAELRGERTENLTLPESARAIESGREARDVIRARDISVTDAQGSVRIRPVSFEVREGEIVGIAAIEGAGHRELLRVLAGRLQPTSGSVELPATIGFIPEDRQRDALLLDAPLVENVALRGAGSARGIVTWAKIENDTAHLLEQHEVVAPGPRIAARALSGGNQQKLVVARELAVSPRAVIAENPTRGLDIRATAAVQARLRQARSDGAAVIFYSSDLDEVLALSDRVFAVSDGTVIEVQPTREAAGRAMLGLAAALP